MAPSHERAQHDARRKRLAQLAQRAQLTWRGACCAALMFGAGHLFACNQTTAPTPAPGKDATELAAAALAKPDPEAEAEAARKRELDAKFPLHGLVTGLQLKVRKEPDPDAPVIGHLRIGSRIRLADGPTKTPTCATGFYPVADRGYACAGEGILVGPTPPESPIAVVAPARDAALPYTYYYVKETKAAEYHRLPSRDEQRNAATFVERMLALRAKDEDLVRRLLAGELPKEPKKPEIVRRFLDRGFFVASTGVETRASRNFVRTVRGAYVKQTDLERREGPTFQGAVLDDTQKLPVAWAVRGATAFVPKLREEDGSLRLVTDDKSKTFERLARVPWTKRERIAGQLFHKLDDGHYLKSWYVAVAEAIARPKDIPANEPWVHVNLEQQTLVLYEGDTPVYATLVSSGLKGHETPVGLFEIRSKHVSATMSDIGPDVSADQRYSIEDVPWTQYFSGSIALHGAFWHGGFGLPHSHGCVNLAPLDAHYIFNRTWPRLADGWHGALTEGRGTRGSRVWITEK